MYATKAQQELDENRLYQQLLESGKTDFCDNLSWLSDKALASDAPDRFTHMWQVYFAVMGMIGDELYGEDICWNSDSDLIEPVLEKLLNQGYEEYLHQLLLGAGNLFIQLRLPRASSNARHLQDLSAHLHKITDHYRANGVLTTGNRMFKWGYIDLTNSTYGDAYAIVRDQAFPKTKADSRGTSVCIVLWHMLRLFLEYTFHSIGNVCRKICSGISRLFHKH